MQNLYELLCLFSVPGLGHQRIRNLVDTLGSPGRVIRADFRTLCSVRGVGREIADEIKNRLDRSFAETQLKLAERKQVRILTYWDEEYPENLKHIPDPPCILFIAGKLKCDITRIAVVGTRSPSLYGCRTAGMLGEKLAQCGIEVVSGMARGIDTCAHRGALKIGGDTLAVLGNGVDVIYPPENSKLYHDIVGRGAVLSELPLGTGPEPGHFPRRNRIISGLSIGTVVVEAGDRSGALITAYMALEQGREVFAVPGNIGNAASRGPHRLIKEGARLVDSVEDILSECGLESTGIRQSPDAGGPLSAEERILWKLLSDEPLHVDRISEMAQVKPSEALSVLLALELKDQARQLSGMRFVRK